MEREQMSTAENMSGFPSIGHVVEDILVARGYSQYRSYASPVIDGLIERERDVADRIVDAEGIGDGLTRDEIRAILEGCGMSVRPPVEAEAEQPMAEADLASVLGRIERTLGALTEFARANGYRG